MAKEAKLHTFTWQGKDKSGNASKGKVDASNIAMAKAQLRKQGILPSKVAKERGAGLFSAKGKPIKPVDIAFFTRQVATMLKSGVPLLQGLDITAGGVEKDKLKDIIYGIKNDVNGGLDFSTALTKYPEHFDDLYCSLVSAGEQSGALEQMLDRIATYKEKLESLKAKIKKALTYPTAVIIVGIVVSAILLVKVVPQFESVFDSFGADLPAFTLFVIHLSEVAQEWWWIVLIAIGFAGYAFNKAQTKSKKFRDAVDKAMLKIPVIGQILHNASIARFSRTLATTFAAGVPLVNALDSAAGASGNALYRDAILQIRNGVSTGQSLKDAVTMTGVFPNMTVQMIAIGEEAGSLEMMLEKVADFYEELVDNAVDNLSSLLEPLIMAVLGVLVGGLVIAMYLPIFQLGNVV
ncbi:MULTISPECIES: type II secretion system F family protein [unclassified Neptuniibacter]|jgi:type IV pilus assembly protein PilC|uniref:type II secretion system F family protein n=1 Tax=unclassified Neptuniibacter TaxID=2630693 RepID=UPI0026E2A084|nr:MULTISPECIES: type II secretion system F family protein [unclassified Neptuniibacter]MDO6512831.1 type II secretion system F family protein [Neptuniibacter sp. 2_MG-2023]MDO6592985.1 type II secretion system F family protein [Neptuniibacter sp. 1_MG-2023]